MNDINTSQVAAPVDSASVILFRPAQGGLEIYLMERNSERGAFAGMSVFPGGVMEPSDCQDGCPQTEGLDPAFLLNEPNLARDRAMGLFKAAVRETFEEAGVLLSIKRLVPFSRWITPVAMKKRFDTRFFLSQALPGEEPAVDGKEIVSGAWITPGQALERHRKREIKVVPPTFMTLFQLAAFDGVESLLRQAASTRIVPVLPFSCRMDGAPCVMYPHDPEYPPGKYKQPAKPGWPSRLILREGFWEAVSPAHSELSGPV